MLREISKRFTIVISALLLSLAITGIHADIYGAETEKPILFEEEQREFYVVSIHDSILNSGAITDISTIDTTHGYTYSGKPLTDEFYFYREMLTDNQKLIYDEIRTGLRNGDAEIKLSIGVPQDEMKEVLSTVYNAVIYDNPELFWVDTTGRTSISGSIKNGEVFLTVIPAYFDELVENLAENKKLLESNVEYALHIMSTLDTDAEVVKYAHDYLTHTINYVLDSSYNQTIYSSLVNKESVCAGYAHGFQYLMQKMGIPCAYVKGSSVNPSTGQPEAHAWNILKLDDEYYAMDVTWDDPIWADGIERPDFYKYDYFNITDEKLSKDHIRAEVSENLPIAYGTAYSYENAFHGDTYGTDFDKKGSKEETTTVTEPTTENENTTVEEFTTDKETTTVEPSTTEEEKTTAPESTTEEEKTTTPESTTEEEKTTAPESTTEEEKTTVPESTTEEEKTTVAQPTTKEDGITTTAEPTTKEDRTTEAEPTIEEEKTTVAQPTTKEDRTTSPAKTTKPEEKTTVANPKATNISKITSKRKKLKIKWVKGAADITGYELQYSTSKKFKNATTLTIGKAKTTSKTIKKLKAKKKYFIRIRTYKTVKGVKYYSKWSNRKKVKTK